jgi:hypothetical protein
MLSRDADNVVVIEGDGGAKPIGIARAADIRDCGAGSSRKKAASPASPPEHARQQGRRSDADTRAATRFDPSTLPGYTLPMGLHRPLGQVMPDSGRKPGE